MGTYRPFVVSLALAGLLTAAPVHAAPDHYQQGLDLLQRQLYDKACEEFRIALLDSPGNPDALCGLGVALYQLKAMSEATQAFDRALAGAASSKVQAQARSGLGDIYLHLGEHAAAVAQYRTALVHYPQWTGARLNLVRALMALAQNDDAGIELARILHDQPQLAEAHQIHGELAYQQGRHRQAHQDWIRAWSLGKSSGETHFRQFLQLSVILGDYRAATIAVRQYGGVQTAAYWAAIGDTWRQWVQTLGSQDALGMDIPLHQRGDLERLAQQAQTAYQRSLLLRPDQPEIRRSLAWLDRLSGRNGLAYLMPQGRRTALPRPTAHEAAAYALAAGDRDLAIQLSEAAALGGSPADRVRHQRLLQIAGVPLASVADTSVPAGRYWLGDGVWQRQDPARAIALWYPLPHDVWGELADAREAWAAGKQAKAWQHLRAAARLDPNESHIFRLAGEWALSSGDLRRGLRALEWGSRIGLPDPALLHQLALVQDRMGEVGQARQAWRRALRINPYQAKAFDHFWQHLLQAPLKLIPSTFGRHAPPRPRPNDPHA